MLRLADINQILDRAGIGLPEYYKWRSRSGCYFCFYQQIGEWQGLQEEHPDLFERAKTYERTDGPRKFTWAERRDLREIEQMERRVPLPVIDDADGCAICHL